MSLIIRVLIYLFVLFLVMIVYTGQQHDNARAILGDAAAKTGRFLMWSTVLVVVMELCFWLFID